ncbi:hypothetical protein FQA39_LY08759 [Lamprigera yunnana]|nr:hypothetical protein FQA39_LY08759 [Lamprigera yunnana]
MSRLIQFAENNKKILGATTNYWTTLQSLGLDKPKNPTIFMKPPSALITEGQSIEIPKGFTVNEEIELGVVIDKTGRDLKECNAMSIVGGYCLALDLTAVFQMKEVRSRGLPWLIPKGFDTACPVGSFIPKSVIDSNNVELWCSVNGQIRQRGNTCDFIFKIPALIAYITKYITLHECDIILTGTPPGMSPILPGDIVEGGIKYWSSFNFDVIERC